MCESVVVQHQVRKDVMSTVSAECLKREDAALLTALIHATPKERKALLKALHVSRIKSVCECAYNLLRGNISLSDKSKIKLKKYKSILRRLAKRDETWEKKKRYLVQKGGGVFLPILLSTVLQAILQKVVNG